MKINTSDRLSKKVLAAACSATCLSGAMAVEAKESNSVQMELEETYVVGSRVLGRSAQDSPVPIDVLSASDLETSAALGGEVGSLLEANIPSFNMPRQSNSDQGDIVRSAQLRGLSPDQVLVLVNGKRRHISSTISVESKLGKGAAAVDFNNIPTSAIERIEVLRDGAAAQYGSDAIAGVINIVLKNADEGGSLSASYGAHSTTLELAGEELDITDGQTGLFSFNKGFSLDRGYINVSGEYRERGATNRAGFDGLPGIGFEEFIVPVPSGSDPAAAPNNALAGKRNYLAGDGESKDLNLAYNTAIELSSGMELYSFGTYSDRAAEGVNFFRYPVSANNVTSIYPNGFIPITDAQVSDFSTAVGVKGEMSEWLWDASFVYGQNTFDRDLKNTLNASLGAASPTRFNIAEYQYSQTVVNLDASKSIALGSIPMNLAVGVEIKRENYETTAGDLASYVAGTNTDGNIGAQGGAGLRPQETVDESRDAYALYVDTEFDFSDDFLVSAALRFEDYDDFGTTTNGKLASRWNITDNLLIRGAISTGFRAPALAQSYFSGSSTSFSSGGTLVSSLNLPVSDALAIANGAQALDAEESVSRSLGLTWSAGDLRLTVDYYEVDIDDRIALSETISIAGTPNVEAIRFFTNIVDTQTRGFDVIAGYSMGLWDFTAAYNQTDTDVVNNPDPAIFGISEKNTYETAAPENKFIVSSVWSGDRLSVMVRATRYGDTERVYDFGSQVYGAMWKLDSDIKFSISDEWDVAVGANNLLDEYPDETISDINYFGNLAYDGGVAPAGINGRYVYARTTYHF